jgi:hypothetical protein
VQKKRKAPELAGTFLISILSITVWVELIRQLYFFWIERVKWFWDLTCDFWAENAKFIFAEADPPPAETIENNGRGKSKNRQWIWSLRPSGFATAFGRAVSGSAGFERPKAKPWVT